jgi:hypothetical protein
LKLKFNKSNAEKHKLRSENRKSALKKSPKYGNNLGTGNSKNHYFNFNPDNSMLNNSKSTNNNSPVSPVYESQNFDFIESEIERKKNQNRSRR